MTTYPKCRCHGTFVLRELVEECCRPLAARLAAQSIRTVIDVPAEHRVVGDRELLVRAVRNLILGAIDAMPDGGTLEATSAAAGDAMELEIADTGESLSDEDLHHAFDPTGALHRGASGWVLAAVRQIAETLAGSITVANCPEGGVAFTLRIPRPLALEAAA